MQNEVVVMILVILAVVFAICAVAVYHDVTHGAGSFKRGRRRIKNRLLRTRREGQK